jgi:hypothetical protein
MFADARLIAVDKAGVPPRDLGLSNYTGQVVGGGGDWVFIAGAPASRLLNVRTGQFRDLPVTGGVFGAVAMGDTLALLQAAGGGSVMSSAVSVYDCNTGSLLGSTSHEAFPAFVFLSFAAPDTLLFVEVSTLRVTPIQIHDGHVTAGASYVLSGDEADRSLRDVQNRPSSPALRRSLVIAHVPGHNGNQLFFLEPHEHAEGFRLAEFDSQGRQLGSFRLRGEDDEATKTLSRGPLKISVTDQTFTLPDRDGVLRTFRRP